MTAIIGVINKRGVSFAADSALSHSCPNNETKVMNSARKIYQLIPGQPVGVAIYGGAQFMGMPLDVLFAQYGKERKDVHFGTVKEYMQDFVNFLKGMECLKNPVLQHAAVRRELHDLYEDALEKIGPLDFSEYNLKHSDDRKTVEGEIGYLLKDRMLDVLEKREKCIEFQDYTFKRFCFYIKNELGEMMKEKFMEGWNRKVFEKVAYHYFLLPCFTHDKGIVFFGYGDQQMMPSTTSLVLSGFLDDRLLYYIEDDREFTPNEDSDACFCPYGQTDAATDYVKGRSEITDRYLTDLFEELLKATEKDFKEFSKAVIRSAFPQPEEEDTTEEDDSEDDWDDEDCDSEAIPSSALSYDYNQAKDEALRRFKERLAEHSAERHQDEFLEIMRGFSPEKLAELAEKLVNLCILDSEMSEKCATVAGPVDVAVITLDGGFQWVKRK